VLETVKKLRWAPDVIHCQGWISHVLPLYLKKVYKDDPIFAGSKVVLSLYDDTPEEKFPASLKDTVIFGGVKADDIPFLEDPDGINLAKTAIRYSDGIILGSENVSPELISYGKKLKLSILPYDKEAIESGRYIDDYDGFYDKL